MNTIIHDTRIPRVTRSRTAPPEAFRSPNYDCKEQLGAVQIVVYVPGVNASTVDIEARGPDLTITARKTRFVRPNWESAHFEKAQLDYRLRLRLGSRFDFGAMDASIHNGVLTLVLPKKP